MFELDEDDTQWTDAARESFRAAAASLVEAVRRHSTALLEMTGTDADAEAIAEIGEQLEAAATAYADTQFELSGTVPPLGLDEEDDYSYEDLYGEEDHEDLDEEDLDEDLDEDGEDGEDLDEDGEDEEAGEPAARLTVLHRVDFVVTDEPAVIQAGKEACHESWDPADDEDPVDITDLGGALQQIQQVGGIEALVDTPGLASAGATTWVLEATELLDESDLADPFALGADGPQRLLHRLDDVAS